MCIRDSNIVWGNSLDDDNIVWGNSLDEDDNIVWGNSLDDDNIVWGNSVDADDSTGPAPVAASGPAPGLIRSIVHRGRMSLHHAGLVN